MEVQGPGSGVSRHRSGREVTRRSCSASNLAPRPGPSPRVPEVAARSATTESSSATEAAARAAEASSRELGRHRGAAAAASGLVILRGGAFLIQAL